MEEAVRVGDWNFYDTTKSVLTRNTTIRPRTTEASTRYPRNYTFVAKELVLIHHCNITFLPIGLSQVFLNMKSLVVWSSGLREIYDYHFNGSFKLEEINFQDNFIESIPENLFWNLTMLTSLNLGGNKIKVLPEMLLTRAKRLQTFIINRNNIEYLPPLLFANNPLKFINLNNNKIKVVQVDFTTLKVIKKVLGIGNICADFFLNKEVDAKQLNELMAANCSRDHSAGNEANESVTELIKSDF